MSMKLAMLSARANSAERIDNLVMNISHLATLRPQSLSVEYRFYSDISGRV